MGPTILLDKSAFESLSHKDHLDLFTHFIRVLPLVLVVEVVADLTKNDPSAKSPEELVKRLARKFVGSGPPLHVGHGNLLRNDLYSADIVMDGRSYPFAAREVPDQGMGAGMFIDISPTNEQIMRWGYGQFGKQDELVARAWRATEIPFPIESLRDSLNSRGVSIAKVKNMEGVEEWVASTLNNPELDSCWLDWIMSKAGLPEADRVAIGSRWLSEKKRLEEFAPYGFHCMKVDLAFISASEAKLLPDLATNVIDVQYLYYAPFCHAFVSNDRLHRRLAPIVLRPDQSFVLGEDLRTDLRERQSEFDALDEKGRAMRDFAYGMYPIPRPGSIVTDLWTRHMGPWPGSGNSVTALSPEDQRRALEEAQARFKEATGPT